MFISKTEKADLFHRIQVLEQTILDLKTSIKAAQPTPEVKKIKSRDWTPEQRAQASERMKKRFADKKANSA